MTLTFSLLTPCYFSLLPRPAASHALQALQAFLDEATGLAAGRTEEYRLYKHDRPEYERKVKQQAAKAEQQS